MPTFRELGYDVLSERYRAIAGPPGLPADVVEYWARVCKQVVDNPRFREEMDKLGQPPAYRGPAEAGQAIEQMTRDMKALVEKHRLAE